MGVTVGLGLGVGLGAGVGLGVGVGLGFGLAEYMLSGAAQRTHANTARVSNIM